MVESSLPTLSQADKKKRAVPIRTMNDPMAPFGMIDSTGEDDLDLLFVPLLRLPGWYLCDVAVPLDTAPSLFEACFRVGRCIIIVSVLLLVELAGWL